MKKHLLLSIIILFQIHNLFAANRYWVGGRGYWNESSHWSTLSGGAGGASIPTANDDVFFDVNSFAAQMQTVMITTDAVCKTFNATTIQYKAIFAGIADRKWRIGGSFLLSENALLGFKGEIIFTSAQFNNIVNISSSRFAGNVTFDGAGSWNFESDITTEKSATLFLKKGTINTNSKKLMLGSFNANSSQVRSLNLHSSEIHIDNIWDISNAQNMFLGAGSSIIVFDRVMDNQHFKSGNLSYNIVAPLTTLCITNVIPAPTCTANLIITMGGTSVTCNGLCNGSASVISVTGGSGNFSYVWTPGTLAGQGTNTITGLCANTYTVKVTDLTTGLFCFCSYSVVAPGVLFDFEQSSSSATCNGLCNGQATVGAAGGTPDTTNNNANPYSYTWLPGGSTGATVANLCAATYTVIVRDANNCTSNTTITINQPTALVGSVTSTNISCSGICNGTATVTPTGGTAPYTFLWSPGGATTSSISNLCQGSYNCVVRDFANCTQTVTATITQPTPLTGNIASQRNVLCNGASTGTVTVVGANGTPNYTYSINGINFFPSGSFSNLAAGTYTVTVKDANGCTTPIIVTITQPAVLLTGTITSQTNVLCFGGNNGSVTVAGAGGTPPYNYSINGINFFPSGTFGSLVAGNYTITVRDANNCLATVPVTITQPLIAITASIVSQTNVLCFGGNNGSVTVTGNNGTPGYTYSINGVTFQASGTFTALTVGTYTITAKDANGCTATTTVTITQPVALAGSITSQTNVSCNGGNNGSVTVAGVNGVPNYTYSINGITFQAGGTFNGLTAGTYTITIKDANACTATVTVSITQPTILVANIVTIINVSCNGGNNGSITVSGSGGTPAYTFSINGITFQAGATFGSLTAGTYTLTVKDSKGCLATVTATVIQPNPILTTLTPTGVNCNGSCNASVAALITGGNPTYALTWLPGNPVGQGTNTISSLCAGTYSLNVVDFLGCTTTSTITVTQPTPLNLITNSTNVSCFGNCNGSGNAIAGGGTPPYSYLWTPGSFTTASISNLCAGTFSATVTDSKGCTRTNTITITQPIALDASLIITSSITCSGSCNGVITATTIGGVGPFTFAWSPGNPTGQGTNTISNLCAGTYNLLITDANNCTVNKTITLTQPPVLTASISNSTSSCNICNASATALAIGGTAPYTYLWAPTGQTTQAATGLCPGITYTVTITDSKGCVAFTTVPIVQTVNITITTLNSILSCFGSCDGIATANAVGGTLPYSYLWSNNQTSQTVSNLCAGSYTITVSDALGCFNSAPVAFTNPPVLSASTTVTNATCAGACNGTATAIPSGGTPPFTYLWNTIPSQNTATATGLCAGSYTVTVKDSKNCTTTSVALITQQNPIVDNPNYVQPLCNQNNGSITVAPIGGSGTYSYSWSPGNPTGQGTSSISNLVAGTYSLTISDGSSCLFNFIYLLNNSTSPTTTISNTNITCNNACNGTATVLATGGAGSFTYDWQPGTPTGDGTSSISTLCAGLYIVAVTDAIGCVKLDSISLQNPPPIVANGTVTNVTCVGLCNGSISLAASGGTGALSYLWLGGGQTTSSIANLCAGTYSVQITDANNCLQSLNFTVTNPPLLIVSLNSINVLCNGACNGSATAVITGGTGTISYAWSNGPFVTPTIVNLCPNVYTVTVTDANSCTAQASVTITQPPVLTATTSRTNITCNGVCNGTATVVGAGGVLPYSYSWSPGANTNSSINNLCAGNYNVIVSDVNGCSVNPGTVIITQPAAIQAGITFTNVTCNGSCNGTATASPIGGSGSYTYLWLPGGMTTQSINSLCVGTYTLTVTDVSGCSVNQTITLSQPTTLIANGISTLPTCFNGCNGSVVGAAIGGTPPYSFHWLPMNTNTTSVSGLCAGTYTMEVTDGGNCTVSQVIAITNPTEIAFTIGQNTASCGFCDGVINLFPTVGQAPFTYVWSPNVAGQGTSTATQLCANTYTVAIADANNCTTSVITTLSNANGPTGETTTTTPVSCFGICDGTASILPIGGTSPYNYLWNNTPIPSVVDNASNLCAGNYIIQVTDANSCIHFSNLTINTPSVILANETITSAICSNVCTGAITVNASGGAGAGYTYQWSPGNPTGQGTASVSALCPGSYSLTIADASNCSNNFVFNVNQSAPLNATIAANNIVCSNSCNGSAYVTIISGTPPYSIQWNDALGQTNDTASALCSGNYTATITDANNCVVILNTTISASVPIAANANITNATCGQCNGQAVLAPSGGTGTYTYLWSNGATAASISNLCVGLLNVDITDAAGCTTNVPIIISNSSGPTAINFSTTPITCFGLCNGSINSSVIGGVAPYSYLWIQGGQTTQNISNQCAGTYFLQVTDANGCTLINSFTLVAPTAINPNQTITAATCGACDGAIALNPNGCSGTYTYLWSNGLATSSLNNLCAGIYTVDITCSSGCSQNFTYAIVTQNGPTLVSSATDVSCFASCNGSVSVVASAGQSPYSYTWNPGSLTTATVSGLCSGNYFVLVSDANGCASASSAQVNAPTPIVTSSPIIINPLCNNNTNGSITVVASGGTLPYSYSWLPGGETTNTISNLSPGTYSVSITDNNGCSIQQSATIVNPAALTLTDVVTNATCNTLSNASIDITVNGGTGAYSYQWTGTQSSITQDLINIPIGTYSVTISDINGCSISNNYVITSFETVIAVAGNDTSFCQASSITLNGNASINATTYNWFQIPGNTNVGATSNITIIPPTGTTSYYLVVGNAGVCTSNDTITISSLALPTAIGSNDTTICLFASASLNASASINAVAYNWYSFPSNTLISSNAVTSVTPPVGVNTFYVVVANSLGCTNVDSVYITVLAAPIARAGNDTSYCYNGSQFTLNASNSINANSYQWFQLPANTSLGNTPVVSATPSVGTNSYYVSILNSSGCRNNDTIVITVLALPIVSAGNDVTILLGASTTIGGSPTGPTGSVFSWLPNQNLDNPTISNPQATPNATTTFTVLVTSTDGCIASDDITVIITPRINPPSGFTPNDDGTNDYWIIDNIELYPDCVVEVYNRWGELLFQSKGYKEKWNGTYKGKQLPVGTYYYIINLNNELYPDPYTGPLTIMR